MKGFIEAAVEAVDRAEVQLVGIQDSLMPIEVGDADLRAGISEVRQLIEGASQSARCLHADIRPLSALGSPGAR